MNNPVFAAIAVALLVGGGAGYGIAKYQTAQPAVHPGASDPAPVRSADGEHSMDASMASMLEDLKQRSGEERDVAFLESMIAHHKGAVEMAKIVAQSTKRPELKQIAENIINAQTAEIATLETWLQQWFGR